MSTCIITGATSGIGKSTAIALSKTHFFDNFVLLGRNKNLLQKVMGIMQANNAKLNIYTYAFDLAELEKIPQVIEDILKKNLEISCLLNIAGFTEPKSLFETSLESFEYTYKINVYAPFLLIRECVRQMKNKGGKILNVASTAGMTPRPGWLSYASSKAAIISMSNTLTEELSEYGITVYCVSPGRCATELRKKLAPDEDPTTIMQPEEVAEVICSLISPQEHCLDGQNIVIRKKL